MSTFLAGQVPTAAELNTAARAGECLGRARRVTNATGSTSTTLIPFLRLDDIPIKAGRSIRIATSQIALDASVANDVGAIAFTATFDGSTPTIASSSIAGGQAKALIANIAHPEYVVINTIYVPAADETLSLLLSVSRLAGTGTILPLGLSPDILEFAVFDCGTDPGDTGVDI